MQNSTIIYPDEAYAIRGAVFEVYHELGNGKIIVELKVVSELSAEHEAQVLNYLKLTGCRLGLLVNFGSYPKAKVVHYAN